MAQEGDVGSVITVYVVDTAGTAVDISTATTKQIVMGIAGDDGTAYTAEFVTNGTDGALKYTTTTGVLTPAGRWEIQARLVMASGADFKTSRGYFTLHANIPIAS